MTNNTNTGGPAFPLNDALCMNGNPLPSRMGMTLRDYFAAKVMQGMLACPATDGYRHDYAKWAYEYADAMLKARES
jgi:hypothetical protein